MKRIVFIFILTFLTSCNASYNSFYFYDEPTYATKEKELTISTEQAAYLFAESYFKDYPSEQEVTANINLIFRNKYVVSPNRIRYNAKIRRYYLTYDTYWVSGKTGKIKKNRRSVLHIDRVKKATKWNISRFYIKSFKKNLLSQGFLVECAISYYNIENYYSNDIMTKEEAV